MKVIELKMRPCMRQEVKKRNNIVMRRKDKWSNVRKMLTNKRIWNIIVYIVWKFEGDWMKNKGMHERTN